MHSIHFHIFCTVVGICTITITIFKLNFIFNMYTTASLALTLYQSIHYFPIWNLYEYANPFWCDMFADSDIVHIIQLYCTHSLAATSNFTSLARIWLMQSIAKTWHLRFWIANGRCNRNIYANEFPFSVKTIGWPYELLNGGVQSKNEFRVN